jgi:DNA-binding MarR family transcriptional regulator
VTNATYKIEDVSTPSTPDRTMDDGAPLARLRSLPSRLLTHTAMYAERLVNERLATADARRWHYAVLVALQTGPASQATLSRRTGIYRSDMVAVINELADRGQVERALDPTDRRRNIIRISKRGRRHLRRLDKLVAAIQDELLAPLSQPEREEFTRILTCLLDHYEGRDASPPAADRD